MPAHHGAAALRSQHRFFASREERRFQVALARNRAIWSVRGWLKCYREGERTHEVIVAIAECMATIGVLSSRS
jgi:hypothetical protein